MQRSIDVTLWLIERRLQYTRRNCFTYKGLRATYNYYYRRGEVQVDWHSVERAVRRLVETGYLQRILLRSEGRRRTIYCLNGGA